MTITLIDKSLQRKLYQVHNFLALHMELKLKLTYVLEAQKLTISKHGMHAVLATKHDIHIFINTKVYLYVMNQALYPTENVKWCILGLFIQDHECINKHCLLDSKL